MGIGAWGMNQCVQIRKGHAMDELSSEAVSDAPRMAQLPIHKGRDAELRLGGLRFEACRREIEGIDGGVTMRVFFGGAGDGTAADGTVPAELLRFDCFRKAPHYHAPGENQKETKIDGARFGDGRAWVFEQLATNWQTLLAEGGFEALAPEIDAAALADLPSRLDALFGDLEEPTETSFFEIEASVLEGLRAGEA